MCLCMFWFSVYVLFWYGWIFKYVGYDLVYLSRFKIYWACYCKFFDVVVCFYMLFILLDILSNHLLVHFLMTTFFSYKDFGKLWHFSVCYKFGYPS